MAHARFAPSGSGLLALAILAVATLPAPGRAEAPQTPDALGPAPFAPSLPRTVIFAANSILIGPGVEIADGDIVVNDIAQGPTLVPGVSLDLEEGAMTPDGDALVVAERLRVSRATILGTAYFDQVRVQGFIAQTVSPVPGGFPIFQPEDFPPFPAFEPGTAPVDVPAGATVQLEAGDYENVTVGNGGTLAFVGGIYNVRSLRAGKAARLLFRAPSELRVKKQLSTGTGSILGPDADAPTPPTAADITVYVAGANGIGLFGSTPLAFPLAVMIGQVNLVDATFWAPYGTLLIQKGTDAEGSFWGRDVWLQRDVRVSFDGSFARQSPAITSAAATTFILGQSGSFTVTTSGNPTPTIVRGGALPGGVTFVDNGDGTGTLSGIPASSGDFPLTFTAANGVPPDAIQSFTLTVQVPPAITSADATTFTVGQAGSFTVTTTGFPVPTIARGGALPTGVTFVDNGDGTGTLSGTPEAGTAGDYALTFTAGNGAPPDAVQSFTLHVVCPQIAVAPAAGALPAGTFGVLYQQQFTPSPPGAYTFSIPTGAVPGGLGLAGDALSGPPGATGNFGFTVRATNAFGCFGETAYTLAIRPDAQPDDYTGAVGNTQLVVGATPPSTPHVFVSGSVLANDQPGGLSVTGHTDPSHGTLVLAANGTFTYTPDVGFDGPSDSFTYTVSSNGVANTGTVTIAVADLVWYVNNAYAGASGTSDGRSHRPFTTAGAAASPVSGADDYVFVHTGTGSTSGAIGLVTGQTLWGQGTTFTLRGLTITGGAKPTLSGTVTIAGNDVTLSSLDIQTGASAGLANTGSPTGALVTNGVAVTTTTGIAVNLANASGSFTFAGVSANGAPSGIALVNTTGSLTVGGGTIQSTTGHGVSVSNASGALTLSLTGMSIAGAGQNGIDLAVPPAGSATFTTVGISDNTITNSSGAGLRARIEGTGSIGMIEVTGNTFTGNAIGVDLATNDTASVRFDIHDNPTMTGDRTQINIAANDATANNGIGPTMEGHIRNNTLTLDPTDVGIGIWVVADGDGDITVNIDGNTVTGYGDSGIDVESRGGAGTVHARIRNNSASTAALAPLAGMFLRSGNGTLGETSALCADVASNTMNAGAGAVADYYLDRFTPGATTFQLQGLTPSPATPAQAETFIEGTDAAPPATAFAEAGSYTAATCSTVSFAPAAAP